MKRVLFFLASALIAGSAYASNLSKNVMAMVTDKHEESIAEKQNQTLILEKSANFDVNMNQYHYSHSSHSSHSSHTSHRSHSSHYSSRF